ncbi:hypothetical protein [Amycolatopsis jejuensis]|nr:hypothetical protein [Amycolatopsis jejuensis]
MLALRDARPKSVAQLTIIVALEAELDENRFEFSEFHREPPLAARSLLKG